MTTIDTTETGLLVTILHPDPAKTGQRALLLAPDGDPPLGPFTPQPGEPTYRVVRRVAAYGNIAVPVNGGPDGSVGPIAGASFLTTTDSRFSRIAEFHGAMPVHDRYETPAEYARLSS